MGLQKYIVFTCFVMLVVAPPSPRRRRLSVIRSTKRGRNLENLMRLGVDKKGIVPDWTVRGPELENLRLEEEAPIQYTAIRPQLNGNMGNSEAPRRLNRRRQFKPAKYTAPSPKHLSAPAALSELSESEKKLIATEFFVTYNYTTNQITDEGFLIRKMQENYGLNQTGELDEPTITAMLQPRCGVPDKPAGYNTFANREKWLHKDITYNIRGYSPDMSQCQIRNAFKRAFRVWEEVVDLTFTPSESPDADIIIYFGYEEHGDGYPFDGANGLLAHAFTPGTEAISGDSHFDENEFWTLGQGRVIDTYYGTSGGDPCVFPFYFKGKSYSACTSVGRSDGKDWCATTGDYDRDKKWGFCPHEALFTYGGNSDNDPCVFPFVFLGKSYDSCTLEGRSDGYKWCATTSNYDTDQKWGFCPSRAHGTEGGNAGGKACTFPFTFLQNQYHDCTTQGRSDYKLWCATTDDYDRDGLWGFCNGDGYSLFLVATHEFGHAIGLDHSNVPGALMYPVYSYKHNFVLPDDDRNGVQDLYAGGRRSSLTPLQLEKCGGDLSKTEIATTASSSTRSTTTARVTTTPSTTTPYVRGRCGHNPQPTDICASPIDAIALVQNEIFVFQGDWYWRVAGRGKSQTRSIERINSYWREVECNVNAAYQHPYRGSLIFFKGSRYFEYDKQNRIMPGFPKEVTTLGLPARTTVDAVVFMQTRNPRTKVIEDRTYYFVGNKVYRADSMTGMVIGTPTILGVHAAWQKLPTNVDAVYRESLTSRYTIFIQGEVYYRYGNYQGRIKTKRYVEDVFQCSRREAIPLPLLDNDK